MNDWVKSTPISLIADATPEQEERKRLDYQLPMDVSSSSSSSAPPGYPMLGAMPQGPPPKGVPMALMPPSGLDVATSKPKGRSVPYHPGATFKQPPRGPT